MTMGLDFLPPGLEILPSSLEFLPSDLEILPGPLEILHYAQLAVRPGTGTPKVWSTRTTLSARITTAPAIAAVWVKRELTKAPMMSRRPVKTMRAITGAGNAKLSATCE